MNDSIMHVSNTPIFDRLAAERGYDRLIDRSSSSSPFSRMVPVKSHSAWGLRSDKTESKLHIATGGWIAQPVPQTASPKNARLSVNVHPEEAEEACGSFHGFVRARMDEFNKKHPGATDVVISTSVKLDGSVNVVIAGNDPKPAEQTGVKLHKPVLPVRPVVSPLQQVVDQLQEDVDPATIISEMEPVHVTYNDVVRAAETVRSEGSFNKEHSSFFAGAKAAQQVVADKRDMERSIRSYIDEDIADRIQESLGIKPETSIGEDTGDTLYMKSIPQPLRIFDEEIPNEE